MTLDIVRLFRSLARPDGAGTGETFRVVEAGWPHTLLGKSSSGAAAFLVALRSDGDVFPVPIELPNIRVRHHCLVELVDQSGARSERTVSVVECRAIEPEVDELFLRVVGNALPPEPNPLPVAALTRVVDHLVELFRAASAAGKGDALGLWGELFVITAAGDTSVLLRAWHSKPDASIDFSAEFERLEVKATSGPYRRHSFSFEQLNPPGGVTASIASIMTQELPTGTSIWRLWDDCLALAGPDGDLRALIDRVCIQTLGRDWPHKRHTAFDRALAQDTLRVYDVSQVPRISDVPAGVGRVRFESDLTRSEPLVDPTTSLASALVTA